MNSFRSFALVFSILLLFSATGIRQTVAQAEEVAQEQEVVYSGPQIGEELVRFEVQDLLSDEPKTLEQLAEVYNVSRERIRQIEVRAFEKLQQAMQRAAAETGLMPELEEA